jgi:hypothetical protein
MYKVQATFSAQTTNISCYLEFQVLLKQYLTFKNSLKFRVQKFWKAFVASKLATSITSQPLSLANVHFYPNTNQSQGRKTNSSSHFSNLTKFALVNSNRCPEVGPWRSSRIFLARGPKSGISWIKRASHFFGYILTTVKTNLSYFENRIASSVITPSTCT